MSKATVPKLTSFLGTRCVGPCCTNVFHHWDECFPLERARQPHRGPVPALYYVSWRAAQKERNVSLADAVPSRDLLDSDRRRN
jgi:hypothetical protein